MASSRINKVYIDIDDTLNSFTLRCLRFFGCPVGDFDYDKFPVECGFDIVRACKELGGGEYNLKEFWNAVPRRVWYTCPKSEVFDAILYAAQEITTRDKIFLLTSPTKCPECLAGKLDWITDNMPEWIHRQYFITPRKSELSRPGRLLIDDADKNIDAWRAGGGEGLLVPRPWNRLHTSGTLSTVNQQLFSYLSKQ